jgi:hypothetical protein
MISAISEVFRKENSFLNLSRVLFSYFRFWISRKKLRIVYYPLSIQRTMNFLLLWEFWLEKEIFFILINGLTKELKSKYIFFILRETNLFTKC